MADMPRDMSRDVASEKSELIRADLSVADSAYNGSKAASGGYQQPPAAHQPQPAHQGAYERQAAAYAQYAQQYAQQQQQQAQQSPTSGGSYQQQASPQSHQQQQQQQQQQHSAPAAHGGYATHEHSSQAAAAAAYHQQQQSSASLYHQQAAAAQYNAQMLANYASVANMGMSAQMGRESQPQSPHVTNNMEQRRPKGATTKGGKRKKNKDPNRPKRPTSAYFFYVAHCRAECEKRGERITRVAQWTKEISQVWREMTPEDRKGFDAKAVVDKARYEEQMNRYKGRDKNRPKRPQSAYFLWLAGFRTRMKDKIPVNKELLRAAGEHWKRLTEVEKAPYEQMAEGERRKYEEAMRQYNMNGGAKRARMAQDLAAGIVPAGGDSSSAQGSPPTPTQPQAPAAVQPPQAVQPQASVQPQQPPAQPPQPQQASPAAPVSAAPASSMPAHAPPPPAHSLPSMTNTSVAAVVPPGMHPSMVAAINMMGMHQSMQQQAQAMGLQANLMATGGGNHLPPQAGQPPSRNGGPPGGPEDSEEEYDDDEYTDEEEELQ